MKCLFCNETIDEKKDISGAPVEERKAWASELSKWAQVSVTANINGGVETLLTGHVCPKDQENLPLVTLHL